MDLAKPALRASAAKAEKAERTEEATVEQGLSSSRVHVEKACAVEPAVAGLDPRTQAPRQVNEPFPGQNSKISVAALRGTTGADFESRAAVLRGAPKKNMFQRRFPRIFGDRDFVSYGEVLRFVLIKGDCCFVFGHETDPSPLYAIPLEGVRPLLEDPQRPDPESITISPTANRKMPRSEMATVLFKYMNGEQAYQFTFDTSNDKSVAKRFLDVVQHYSKKGGGTVTASVVTANQVGQAAAKTQPMI